MKQLLLDVKNRLATSTVLKYIDTDWGQMDLQSPPVMYPCVLVDIVQGQFDDETGGFQIGILILSVKVSDLMLSPGSKMASAKQKDNALLIFDYLSEINRLLHGWSGSDNYGPLTRVSITKSARQDGIKEYVINYKVQFTDDSAVENTNTIKKTSITVQMEKQ